MALIKVNKFVTIDEMAHFLEGGIVGGHILSSPQPEGPPGAWNLVGSTLTFLNPAVSVTFVAGALPNNFLRYSEVKAQIEAAAPGLLVKNLMSGKLGIIERTPTTGVVISASPPGGFAFINGSVDLNTLTYGAGGTVDGLTLSLEINTVAQPLVTFAAPGNRAALVAQINAVIANALASVSGTNLLHIQTNAAGGTKKVKVLGGTALAALGLTLNQQGLGASSNDANVILGFYADENTTGKVYGSPYTAPAVAPYYLSSYSSNDNCHVVYTYE